MQARRALEFSGNNAFSLPRVDAYKVLYEVALKRDDLATALDHHRSYAEADKAYLDDVNARELAYLQSRNEVQQKDQEIALLSKQNEVLQLKQQVTSQSAQNSRLMLILLAVVLASLGYWAYRVKRVQMAFRRLAHTDALTGISNRGHFRQQVEACLVQCQQRGEEVGMVVFDLDNFKNVNDRYGHAGGDWVLQQIARACRGRCRKGDHFGRLGGEEFAIVLPGCDLVATERIAEACRESLAAIDTRELGDRFTVTSSFGCTSTAVSGHSYEKLLAHADQAMYCAKRGGRDRVRLYVEGEGSPDATPRAAEAELA